MKHIYKYIFLASAFASGPALAANLTYPEIIKIIGSNKNVKSKLVGQTATVNLLSPGPDSLMVNPKDLTFFECEKRDPSFKKAGTITAKITKYGEDQDGNPVITLDKCAQ